MNKRKLSEKNHYDLSNKVFMKLNQVGYLSLLLICLSTNVLFGQSTTLQESEFIKDLLRNHPQAKRAMLQQEVGDREVQAAQGLFDPVLAAAFSQKSFQDKLYYRRWDADITQPTTFLGIEFNAGLETNSGSFLNPERNTPLAGLGFAGVKLPLLQGMLWDTRRNDLRLSRIFQQQTRFLLFDINNELLLNGLKAYWNWNRAQMKLELLQEVLTNNRNVLEGIRVAFLSGDRPAIDTVEAFQQYQRILLQYNKELVSQRSAVLMLNNYRFDSNGKPMPIGEGAKSIPTDSSLVFSNKLIELSENREWMLLNPTINLLRNENERLQTRLRWEKERRKPRLDLKYNLLADRGMSVLEQQFLNENYQVGITFQYPLLIRNARARTAQVKANIWQNDLATTEERIRLENSIAALSFSLSNIRQQVALGSGITDNARKLYEAERMRFDVGESSVFLVNTREIQYLQAQNILIDLKTEEILATYQLLYEMGILYRIAS
jgi:outer membrane protein TolC